MSAIETGRTGRFDLGRVMERTFTVIGKNFATFLLAALVLAGIPSALVVMGQAGNPFPTSPTGWGLLIVGWALSLIGTYVLQAAIVVGSVNTLNGRPVRLGNIMEVGIRNFLPLLGLAIVMSVGIGLGMILLIVPGMILAVLWCVAAPSLVAEKRGIFESLQRSRELTKGYRWPIFGLIVIYFIVYMVIAGTVSGVSVATGGNLDGTGNLVVTLIATPLIAVAQALIGSTGVAAIYYELRTAKEGVGADELAAVFD